MYRPDRMFGNHPGYTASPAGSYHPQQSIVQSSTAPTWATSHIQHPQPNEPERRVSEPVTASQPCFNCGNHGHWAQDCPEARRMMPAGRAAGQKPFKRQRTDIYPTISYQSSAGIVPPPLNRYNQIPQHHHTHPVPNQAWNPYTGQPLPNPILGNQSQPQHWQQQNWSQGLVSPHINQQWNGQVSPSPTSQYPPQQMSQFHQAATTAPTAQHLTAHAAPSFPLPQYPPAQPVIPDRSPQTHQQGGYFSQAPFPAHTAVQQIAQDPATSINQTGPDQHDEPWLEELKALDQSEETSLHSHLPANQVAQALPSTMQDQDLVVSLPIASTIPLGAPVSSYFRETDLGVYLASSQKKFGEGSRLRDPALLTFIDDGQVISKDELISEHHRLSYARRMSGDSDDSIPANSPQGETPQEPYDAETETSSHIADGLPTPSNSLESEEERLNREQEERLAALGVTGFAKPVKNPARRPAVLSASTSMESQVRTTDRPVEINNKSSERRRSSGHEKEWDGYLSGESPTTHDGQIAPVQTPPASAPHESRQPSRDDSLRTFAAADSSPTSAVFSAHSAGPHSKSGSHEMPPLTKSLEHDQASVREDKHHQTTQRSIDDHLSRKRSTREVSSDSDSGPRRQKTERSNRKKRNAPKVAAAYSRRW